MSMQKFWHYTYDGDPQFSQNGDILSIINNSSDDQGSWLSEWQQSIEPGQEYTVTGTWDSELSRVIIVFFVGKQYFSTQTINENGQVFTVPNGVNNMRLDCRLWKHAGSVFFINMQLAPFVETEPEPPEPEPEPEAQLPIPPPDTTQKHHVTGWKWGRNISLMVQGDEVVPPDRSTLEQQIPYEVTGFQHGRRLDLQIGNMFVPEETDPPILEPGVIPDPLPEPIEPEEGES